jgi:hypothetical protein
MAIVDVKPSIDKRVIVISALDRIRITLPPRKWCAIGERIPRFVWTNEVDGFNLGTVTLICRGISGRL